MFVNLQEFEEIEYAPSEKHDGCAWIKVVDGCWICDGKWEHQTSVVQNIETGKFYEYSLSRSGSYYSGYYYTHVDDDGVELSEVVKTEKQVTVTEWSYV